MKKTIFALLTFMAVAAVTGCYYDKASLIYPSGSGSCDTTGVKLSGDVSSILSANCYSCHGGTADLGAGIQLDNYDVLKAYVDNGLLLASITQDGSTSPMPQGGSKLSDCNISKISAWINSGSPNN